MTHYDSLKVHLTEIETSLEENMVPFTLQVVQLNRIYGISTTASCAITAEIGIDMRPFKMAEHICSWAGLCPVITKVSESGIPIFLSGTGEANRKKVIKR